MGSLWEVTRFINLSFGRTAGCLRRLEPGAAGGGAVGMQERQRRWDGFGVGEERDIIKGHPRLCPDLSILTSWGAGDALYRRGRLRKELYGRNVVSVGTFSAWHVHQMSQWKGQVGSLISESGAGKQGQLWGSRGRYPDRGARGLRFPEVGQREGGRDTGDQRGCLGKHVGAAVASAAPVSVAQVGSGVREGVWGEGTGQCLHSPYCAGPEMWC